MNDIAIRVDDLSKLYRIGYTEKHTTLRDSIASAASAPLRRLRERRAPTDGGDNTFWALRGVSFEVPRGQVVGIVGRNGAGKSTLLKVLSRITGPTGGRAEIHGRVGSLLEVGTGFHPELTGRENIFMNGAILGMSRQEIRGKFDEIVAFSEVEKFIDTPVKRYSSGMYTRLAFSVAAHLEPEIMIVDEVLAVGDMAFQQKCMGKMNQVAGQGRTVLFVSHNMGAVETLCSRVILLKSGEVEFDGDCLEGIKRYYEQDPNAANEATYTAPGLEDGTGELSSALPMQITRAQVTSSGYTNGQIPVGAPMEFEIEIQCRGEQVSPIVGIGINDKRGLRVSTLMTRCTPELPTKTVQGRIRYRCLVPNLALYPGLYSVKLSTQARGASGEQMEAIENAMHFTVVSSDYFNNAGYLPKGIVLCKQQWELD